MGRDSQEGAGLLLSDDASVESRDWNPKPASRRLRQVAITVSFTFNVVAVILLPILLQRLTRNTSPSGLLYSESLT